ncbi:MULTISPECIES: hypothetical protein [Acetobacter]|uniref:hypothetical protein n=1 Tax=Acetobacter TaxID=434 RepID=UPI001EE2A2BF|nr:MULTISPECIES: hypothetical protein [Acetobacter]
MGEALPDLMTTKDVLTRLNGRIGRTRLLEHLRKHPEYNGGPTHRRWGKKFVFSPDDYQRLIESMECPSSSSRSPTRKTFLSGGRSGVSEYWKVRAQQTAASQKNTGQKERRSSGRKNSMEPALS